jgi:hypothetical protein
MTEIYLARNRLHHFVQGLQTSLQFFKAKLLPTWPDTVVIRDPTPWRIHQPYLFWKLSYIQNQPLLVSGLHLDILQHPPAVIPMGPGEMLAHMKEFRRAQQLRGDIAATLDGWIGELEHIMFMVPAQRRATRIIQRTLRNKLYRPGGVLAVKAIRHAEELWRQIDLATGATELSAKQLRPDGGAHGKTNKLTLRCANPQPTRATSVSLQ